MSNEEESPENLTFAQRRAIYMKNIEDSKIAPTKMRRQSTPGCVDLKRLAQSQSSISKPLPPPQHKPNDVQPEQPEKAPQPTSPRSVPAIQPSTSSTNSIAKPELQTLTTPVNPANKPRVIWVTQKVDNPFAGNTPSANDLFKAQRQRRASDGALLGKPSFSSPSITKPISPTNFPQPADNQPGPEKVSQPTVAASTPPPEQNPEEIKAETTAPQDIPVESSTSNIKSVPSFGSQPANQESSNQPTEARAFRDAFKFFDNLGVMNRRYSREYEQEAETRRLEEEIGLKRKRSYTDVDRK